MSITVSSLSHNDYEQWQTLFSAYADFYKMPMDRTILENVWSWIFDDNKAFFSLIAKDENGQAVGFMHYRAMPSPLRGKDVGFLDDLFVDPACRGSGVVDALFDALHASAKEQHWPSVRWITAENNYRGRAVYDRVANKTHWQTYQLDIS